MGVGARPPYFLTRLTKGAIAGLSGEWAPRDTGSRRCSGRLALLQPRRRSKSSSGARAQHVEIIKGPALEISHDDVAIVRWTTNNPRGDDDHYSVTHYGTDPNDLEPDGEKSHPTQSKPSRNDISGADGWFEAGDDLLLQGNLDRL